SEVSAANLPDQVAAILKVMRADAALAGVMGKAAHLSALVKGANGVAAKRAEAHRRYVEDRGGIGLLAVLVPDRDPEGRRISHRRRAGRVGDELMAVLVDVELRAEGAFAALVLGARIDEGPLAAGER